PLDIGKQKIGVGSDQRSPAAKHHRPRTGVPLCANRPNPTGGYTRRFPCARPLLVCRIDFRLAAGFAAERVDALVLAFAFLTVTFFAARFAGGAGFTDCFLGLLRVRAAFFRPDRARLALVVTEVTASPTDAAPASTISFAPSKPDLATSTPASAISTTV